MFAFLTTHLINCLPNQLITATFKTSLLSNVANHLKTLNMGPLVGILGITLAIVVIINAILNHRIKMRMIKDGHVDENSIKILSQENNGFKLDTLKWGIILLFGGIGLIILEFIPYGYDYRYSHGSPLPFGIETVSLALGFLVYYFIARNINKNQ
jgi:hypothetical protein